MGYLKFNVDELPPAYEKAGTSRRASRASVAIFFIVIPPEFSTAFDKPTSRLVINIY
jgi:hypothetical protein